MAVARILIDGYSLLYAWTDLAPGRPRHGREARDELIAVLTRFQDAVGTPVTIFFDGSGAPAGIEKPVSTREMEVLYSSDGRTADDLIERTVHRLKPHGEGLVVTDDRAERDTVIALGGLAVSCDLFIRDVYQALEQLQSDLKKHNRDERGRFGRR